MEHEKLIDKMVSADFTKYITEDLNRPLDDTRTLLEEVSEQWEMDRQIREMIMLSGRESD